MSIKTDITPIVKDIEHLTLTQLKILVICFHYGTYLEPERLESETGSCMKSIRKALKSKNVRNILKQLKAKNNTTRLILMAIQKELESDSVF